MDKSEKYKIWLEAEVLVNGYQGTFRSFFKECMVFLILKGEDFSGKRPLGTLDWKEDLVSSLIHNKYIIGQISPGTEVDGISFGKPINYNVLSANYELQTMITYI
jgi:hypothetical protein